MKSAPLPIIEAERLRALQQYRILDTEAEPLFDNITTLAAHVCDVPIALVTFIDRDRQWTKSSFGLPCADVPRRHSFCAHAILSDDIFEVTNAETDVRFRDSAMVTGTPNLRFYAGAPLITSDGFGLGTVCVIDRKPRRLTRIQRLALRQLGQLTMAMLESRRNQSRFASLGSVLDKSPDEILVFDADSHEITYANESALHNLGYTWAELLRIPAERINPGYEDTHFTEMTAPLKSGEKKQLVFQTEHIRKHGTKYPVEVRWQYAYEQAQPVYTAIVSDITGRKQTEQSLQRVNERLTESLRALTQQQNELSTLRDRIEALQTCSALDEAYDLVARFVPALLGDHVGALYMINDTRTAVEAVRHWGELSADELAFSVQDCWSLRRNKPHLGGHGSTFRCRHVGARDADYLCVPMLAKDNSIGMLHIRASPANEGLLTAKSGFIEILAGQVALSLANIRLQETLRDQAIRDPLTGLFNRRYLEETLVREEGRAQRAHLPISFIAIDIDLFKRINDTHGHDAGDTVLREFGAVIRSQTREGDIPCRYGGEEFLVVLPGGSFDIAKARAEAIRQAVEHLELNHRGKVLPPITVSAGVAAYPLHGQRWPEVLAVADKMLYVAKEEGRNRVVFAPHPSGQIEFHLPLGE